MIEKKILFIDDEESQRDVIKRVLKRFGYSVTLSSGSYDALKILENEHFPLIITDLSMPDMDGTMLCQTIRKTNTESIIYALSGYIESFESEKLESYGFNGYLRKPITYKMLREAVDGAFDKLLETASGNGDKVSLDTHPPEDILKFN